MAESEIEGYIPVIAKSIASINNSRDCFKEPMQTKQDRHVYVLSSDHGNPDGGGTGDIGSDEYSHYKAL